MYYAVIFLKNINYHKKISFLRQKQRILTSIFLCTNQIHTPLRSRCREETKWRARAALRDIFSSNLVFDKSSVIFDIISFKQHSNFSWKLLSLCHKLLFPIPHMFKTQCHTTISLQTYKDFKIWVCCKYSMFEST